MTNHDPADQHNPDRPTYPHVTVRLTGTDGNVYSIIGHVARALRREVSPQAATAFTDAAFACHSYDEVLRLAMNTVEID
jgi:hypothetical protein